MRQERWRYDCKEQGWSRHKNLRGAKGRKALAQPPGLLGCLLAWKVLKCSGQKEIIEINLPVLRVVNTGSFMFLFPLLINNFFKPFPGDEFATKGFSYASLARHIHGPRFCWKSA